MNKLHVTSLPRNITSQDLCGVFERIGPVLHAKVIKDLHGNCIVGIVEMVHAEDVEEVLTTNDRISIGGRRPIIWKVQAASIAQRIQEESYGIHLEECNGRWYVFHVSEGRLRWCRMLPKHEALRFYRQYLDRSEA
jgi:hypothetical protein